MIVGEAEVQGQVKRAYELALVEGATGPISNRLFRDALGAGKRVRTETALGRSRVSVSSVAVDLARDVLGDLETRRVLVVGAGENGELTAKALADRGVRTVFVANRRYDRAIGLAQRFGGEAVRFDDLPAEIVNADIVVGCTSSPHLIVGADELALVTEQRAGRPLLLIDIAVPRDIDPRVRELPGITLYDMDDLQRTVARNLDVQEAEAARARTVIEEELQRFDRWLSTLDVVPTIAALRERGEEIVRQVLRENEGRWESLSEADRERARADGARGRSAACCTSRRRGSSARRTRTPRTCTYRRCASCSGSTRARSAEAEARGHVARRAPRRAGQAIELSGPVRLATRGSALALAQARLVAGLLDSVDVELVELKTSGDRGVRGGDKSRWVKELEEALLDGRADLAVHSAKDVPGELPDGLSIVGVPERADARDAVCGAAGVAAIPEGAVVGTSSLRRRSQLLALRPDLVDRGHARERRHAPARSCASASTTRSCWRGPGSTGSAWTRASPSTSAR